MQKPYITLNENWNKSSLIAKIMRLNHDSDMEAGEVLRLAEAGIKLLQQQPKRVVLKTKDKDLIACYNYATAGKLVTASVMKGIHQRDTLPHITLSLNSTHLHLWLSATPGGAGAISGQIYSVVSVSASEGKENMLPPTVVVGITRGKSISNLVVMAEQGRLDAIKQEEDSIKRKAKEEAKLKSLGQSSETT